MLQGAGGGTVEQLIEVNGLLREIPDKPQVGLTLWPVKVADAVVISVGDSSWANTAGHKTQAAYTNFLGTKKAFSEDGDRKCSLAGWQSHRLRRACHCTLYAEGMASRAAGWASLWLQLLLLEIYVQTFKATTYVKEGGVLPDPVKNLFAVHVVTDAKSLWDTVVRSTLPADFRAALEVVAIRELIVEQNPKSQLEDEDDDGEGMTGRLKEVFLEENYHWVPSDYMKAVALTKVTTRPQREEWMANLSHVTVLPQRDAAEDNLTSKKRVQLPVRELKASSLAMLRRRSERRRGSGQKNV